MKDRYRKAKGWCNRCDMYLLEHGKRCPVCGFKDVYKKGRKSRQQIEIEELDD
jgi:hypothetical protein